MTTSIEYPRKFDETLSAENLMISVSGIGTNKGFATFITNIAPNYNMLDKGRHFEILANKKEQSLFEIKTNISEKACLKYKLNDRELYNYIYAILHSNEYREKYRNNLVKDLPRIPNVNNKEQFIDIGKKLIHLHLNYEKVDAYDDLDIEYKKINCSYRVQKMKFFKKDRKDIITFNNDITIRNIPEKAYNYIINGKSAIDWIVDQYQVTTDKKSGIIDDPNEYSDDPKYIFNLLLSIINLSVQTVDLVNSLPKMEIIEE
ncbi:MAG: type ISP restriction/modification enzyme [Culicoidibacterales bacterium]